MFIWWGTRTRERVLGNAYFVCPRCGSRQPCRILQQEKVSTLYFFPIGPLILLGQAVECATCRCRFPASDYSSPRLDGVSEDLATEKWKCPKCAAENPNTRYSWAVYSRGRNRGRGAPLRTLPRLRSTCARTMNGDIHCDEKAEPIYSPYLSAWRELAGLGYGSRAN